MANLSVAFEQAAGLLNDPVKVEWTDDIMLPRAKKAHMELQLRLYEFGIPVLKEITSEIPVPLGTDKLPSQPADLVEPLFLKEKGSTDPDTAYVPMTEVNVIPIEQATATTIRYWAWREEIVTLMKSTVARVVQMRYIKGLTAITSASSPIGVIFGENFMGPRIASLCFQSVGQIEDATINNIDAEKQLSSILRSNVRGMGHRPGRRIPFSVSQAMAKSFETL